MRTPLFRAYLALGWLFVGLFALCAPPQGAHAATGPDPERSLRQFEEQRASAPVFAESFSEDLHQWGLSRPLGSGGMVLDRLAGTLPGVRQLFVPGLLVKDAIVSCRLQLAPGDQGYLMFRSDDESGASYQLLLTSRTDGEYVSGFVKKRTLDRLFGGTMVGRSYRASFPANQWLQVEVFFRGKELLAVVDGEIAAYYDRADAPDGSISLISGARPLGVRDLSVTLFRGDGTASPSRTTRREPSELPTRVVARPLDDASTFPSAGLPLAGAPREEKGEVVGMVPGAEGAWHTWRLDTRGRFFLDEEELIPLRDTDGLYFARMPAGIDHQRAVESIRDTALISRIRKHGLAFLPARVRLVDYINALDTDHEFSEEPVLGGRSRIIQVGDRRYRATSARRWLSYYAYTAFTDAPLAPHLLLAEAPNDRERCLTVRIHPPDGSGGDPEYGVGAGTFTGRGSSREARPFNQSLLFLPQTERVRFTISRMPMEGRTDASGGAAVSQVFLFALVDTPSTRPNPVLPPVSGAERTLALSVPSARALLRQCGSLLETAQASAADRASGYRYFTHLLRFLGFNAVDVGVVEVSPEGAVAEYAGSRALSSSVERGVFSDLVSLATRAGIRVTPTLPALPLAPQVAPGAADREAWALVDREGRICRAGAWPVLNPLHPGTSGLVAELAAEVASRCADSATAGEVALRVEGSAGGCLPHSGDLSPTAVGYGPAERERFTSETGIAVPGASPHEAYAWLRAHAWERWEAWRCESLFASWLLARNAVRTALPGGKLLLKVALPDRHLARTGAWADGKTPVMDLLRAHGFDPWMFPGTAGITLERGYDVAYSQLRAAQHQNNAAALDEFDYQPGLADLFDADGTGAVEVRIAPWEERGQHLGSEFYAPRHGHWGASTVTPWGRYLFRPLTHALRTGNPYRLAIEGAEFATAGREHDWRRFARAYRALPAVEPVPFAGSVVLRAPRPKVADPLAPALPEDLVVARYADRVGIINDSAQRRTLELRPTQAIGAGETWIELATGQALTPGEQSGSYLIELEPYDLRVLVVCPTGIKTDTAQER